jgi:bifunctional non-homologous end joining protein LigD
VGGSELIDGLAADARGLVRRQDDPHWIEPMLATLVGEPPSGDDWVFERKLDGERCLGSMDGHDVALLSRSRRSIAASYPEVAEALATRARRTLLVDGEIVALVGGQTSFARLQQRMQIDDPERARATGVPIIYYLFDLVHLDGADVSGLPLLERKRLLCEALSFGGPLRYLGHRAGDGRRLLAEACRRGWEGLIAKDVRAPYRSGRGRAWLKLKCVAEQEFVIGGFTEPKGSRVGLGAILVGYYRDGQLEYAGKVGTGFSQQVLLDLRSRLVDLEQPGPSFAAAPSDAGTHWVAPELVAEVGFAEWTRDGKLRQPRYLGLRRDKDPRDVIREVPAG